MIQYDVVDGVSVLRLNAPPLNAISLSLLEKLRTLIRRSNVDSRIQGILITGDSDHFSPGADINLFKEHSSGPDAARLSRDFQKIFQEVEDCSKPVVAAVAGHVMAGALELAAACHFRIAANGSRFSMPEVKLGISPGAGGTQRLPRLIGPEAALGMMLTARAIGTDQALAVGLIDQVCQGDQLVETARGLLESAAGPQKTSARQDKVSDPAKNSAAIDRAARFASQTRPEIITPIRIVAAVEIGLRESVEAGLLAERRAFSECIETLATKNRIHLFFATHQAGKIENNQGGRRGMASPMSFAQLPVEAPQAPAAKLAKIAVIGMGAMGTGIALSLIAAGKSVVACDREPSALADGVRRIEEAFDRRVARGKLAQQRRNALLGLISTTTEWQDLAGVDLAIESVVEDPSVKRSVIGRLEDVCDSHTVIASNTSAISLDVLADQMRHPERLLGMHFFNPAHRVPLVEVIRREATSAEAIAEALELAKALSKTPVLVKNREGFLVNRVLIPYLKEAFFLLEDGADPQAIDSAMVEFGFSTGPLALIDTTGLDVLVLAERVMGPAFPDHQALSQIAVDLVEAGHLGQKTGRGVYRYEKGDYTPHHSDKAEEIIARAKWAKGHASAEVEKDEITQRLTLRIVNEAFFVLEEEIAQRSSDVDVALVLGAGFPEFRGGVVKYAHDLGLDKVRAGLRELTERFGERFVPSEYLRKMKGG